MPVASRLIGAMIDCPDPRKLAAFYQALTGWDTTHEDDDYTALAPKDQSQPGVSFQRVEPYLAPVWPQQDHPQQVHLDFYADADLDIAEAAALALGAVKAEHQPRPDEWRVMIDPAGHPFCLCAG
jgi:predicted enzyme related to lactoylglutathione lyase